MTARDLGHARGIAFRISIDVVQMTVRQGDRVSIDAQWRIVDPRTGTETVGGDEFSAALRQDGYAAVAQGLSEFLALLADPGRRADQVRRSRRFPPRRPD